MTLREKCDPALATIRNAIKALPPRGYEQVIRGMEEARYMAFSALENLQTDQASEWCKTLEEAAMQLPEAQAGVKASILRGVNRIRDRIKGR